MTQSPAPDISPHSPLSKGPPDLLNIDQAAKRLGICGRQLRSLVKEGQIPFVNVGGGDRAAYRFRPVDIEAFISVRLQICVKSEVSTSETPRARGSTTSKFGVIDFVARRNERLGATPKNGSRSFGKKRRRKSPV